MICIYHSKWASTCECAGGGKRGGGGEWDRHPELQLLWPNPDEALGGEFEAVSRRVWEPIQENLTRVRKTRAKKK